MKLRLAILLFVLVITVIFSGYFFWYQYFAPAGTTLPYIDKPIINADLSSNLSGNQNQPVMDNGEAAKEPAFKSEQYHLIKILKVPFTVQAPFANWELPYKEACEEAAMIMIVDWLSGRTDLRLPPAEADQRILELVSWEAEHGYAIDLTAAEVVKVLAERFSIKAEVKPYHADEVRREIEAGRPVILPAAGRLLGNPYFRRPGPLYHMLLVRGFDGEEFITNDPGTKRGENFRYHASVFQKAIHDWNGGEVELGEQVMIVVVGK
ncbi:MAG: C39 family peptidase [Patescibacteria group bacterium]